jgi:hypothetical protein|nr:hypothetical protein [Kofleriaceae bacterium]
MPMTMRATADFVRKLADVEAVKKWNRDIWCVNGHSVAWERPLSKTDLERLADAATPAPKGDVLAVATENLDAKDALLAMELPGFFTIQHFNGYPAVLIELRLAQAKHVRAAIAEAHRVAAAKPVRKSRTRPARARTKSPRKK